MTASAACERVERLLEVARRVAGPSAAARTELVARLQASSGLSPEGVEWALLQCLELTPTPAELTALIATVPVAPRAHVLLPAQVCVAALRALALALASAPQVFVKPSRRDPVLAEALGAQAAGLFTLVTQLEVAPGDHVWAYGADLTLEAVRRQLPAGAVLHAHGSGFGVAVVDLQSTRRGLPELAQCILTDTLAFDQRGCLSPRLVLVLGGPARAGELWRALGDALVCAEQRVPRGRLSLEEQAEATWYRQCAACFGEVFDNGAGLVSLRASNEHTSTEAAVQQLIPPAGRHLEIIPIAELDRVLETLAPWLTSVGCSEPELQAVVRRALPRARVCALGQMQRPPLDGPVDRRADPSGHRI